MSDPGRQTVTVQILGQEYRVRTDTDVDGVQQAASLVEDIMDRIRSRTGTADSLDLAIMTALNLARDLGALRGVEVARSNASPAPERLRALIDDVESVLAASGTSASS